MSSYAPAQQRDGLESIKAFIEKHCIVRDGQGETIRNSSGQKCAWLFDLRPLLLDGRMATIAANLFWDQMQRFWPFQVAGPELAAVPLMVAIAIEGERRGFPTSALIVRHKRKKHGRLRQVEGNPVPDLPVVLVDDSINTARGIHQALVVIRDLGLRAEHAFSVAHFHSAMAQQWCGQNKVRIHHLVTPADFGLPFYSTAVCKTDFQLLWTFAAPAVNYSFAVAKSSPALFGNNLLFGSDSGDFWCLDAKTGRIKWWHRTGDRTGKGIVSSPLVVHGKVYFGSYSGVLYCLDAETGREIWNSHCCRWIGSSPCHANGYIYVGLEFDAPDNQGALGKFSAITGELVWQVPTRQMLHGSPVYSAKHGAIVLGTNDSTVLVIDAQTGEIRRSLTVGGPVKYPCALYNDLAVFGSFDGKIYVWDHVANEIKVAIETGDIVYSRALIVGTRAFMGSADHTFHVIDLERFTEIACINVKEKVHSSPALIDGTVFFGTSAGELIGIHPDSLDITHRYQFPERLTNTALSDGDRMFVYGYDNKMWAILP
jgi:outer membrane protein assembly factor BamB/orotate phosphoribosyltransferase